MVRARRSQGASPTSSAASSRVSCGGPGSMMMGLLGNFSLSLRGVPAPVAASAQRLLALLGLRGAQRRVFVAGMLWPEVDEERALTRLRSTLWRLRKVCPELLAADELSVGLGAGVEVDARSLVEVARLVVVSPVDPSGLSAAFHRLVDCEDLLVGWYEDWVLEERERLGQLRVRALEALADRLVAVGRFAEALEAATTAVRLDPLRESTHRSVMRVHLAENNPASARQQVERYRRILHGEFGAHEPTRAMLELLESPPAFAGDANRVRRDFGSTQR